MERESFVFHREFIEDLPEAYQQKFVSYAIQYGIYGIEPEIAESSLEYTVWLKTKRRIDEDYARYQKTCESRERRNQVRREQYQTKKSAPSDGADETAGTESEPEPEREAKPRKRFRKPSVEEVAEYCHERGNAIDAQTFCDYYETNGWTIGKGGKKMQDWKAAVRTWENRRREEERTRPPSSIIGNESTIPQALIDVFNTPVGN